MTDYIWVVDNDFKSDDPKDLGSEVKCGRCGENCRIQDPQNKLKHSEKLSALTAWLVGHKCSNIEFDNQED